MKYPRMNVKRLKRLRKELCHLKEDELRTFDMSNWLVLSIEEESATKVTLSTKGCKVQRGETVCRTAACALGTAAMIPEFKRAGLKIEFDDSELHVGKETRGSVIYRRYSNEEAGQKFFGLTPEEANAIFMPQSYPMSVVRPADVVARIDSVLSGDYR